MGMYNEVRKKCPTCGSTANAQIPQFVMGFGDFHLDYPRDGDFVGMSHEDKEQFAEIVSDKTFYCKYSECEHEFQVKVKIGESDSSTVYI